MLTKIVQDAENQNHYLKKIYKKGAKKTKMEKCLICYYRHVTTVITNSKIIQKQINLNIGEEHIFMV